MQPISATPAAAAGGRFAAPAAPVSVPVRIPRPASYAPFCSLPDSPPDPKEAYYKRMRAKELSDAKKAWAERRAQPNYLRRCSRYE